MNRIGQSTKAARNKKTGNNQKHLFWAPEASGKLPTLSVIQRRNLTDTSNPSPPPLLWMHYSSVCQFGGTLPIPQLAPKRGETKWREKVTARKRQVRRKTGVGARGEHQRHQNKRTSETEAGEAQTAQSLSCKLEKHSNRVSHDPQRAPPGSCFNTTTTTTSLTCFHGAESSHLDFLVKLFKLG